MDLPENLLEFWKNSLHRYAVEFKARLSSSSSENKSIETQISSLENAETTQEIALVVQCFLQQAIGRTTLRNPLQAMSPNTASSGPSTSASSDLIYKSVPLSNYKSDIRLAEVLPGSDSASIVVKLSTTSCINGQPYEALSYVWGARDNDETIQLNGYPFQVSRNLAAALRRLRPVPGTTGRVLWIDALCINQDHTPERSAQVALMGTIYKQASDVLVFLGEEKDNSNLIMQYLSLCETLDEEEYEEETITEDDASSSQSFQCGCSAENDCLVRQRINLCGFDETTMLQASTAFFKRPWWSRMWVVQEFALAAQEPKWYCGWDYVQSKGLRGNLKQLQRHFTSRTMPLNGEAQLIAESQKHNESDQNLARQRHYNVNLILARSRIEWINHPPASLMISLLYRESTDPRDRIFALFDMLEPVSKKILYPDYSARLDDIKEAVSAYFILYGGPHHLYSRVHLDKGNDLPSWTLNFTKPLAHSSSGYLKDPTAVHPPISIHNGVLSAKGVILDRIHASYDFEAAKTATEKVRLLWRFEAAVENSTPPEPLQVNAEAFCIAPFSVSSPKLIQLKRDVPFPLPAAQFFWGERHFIIEVLKIKPILPRGLEYTNATCERWQYARPNSDMALELFNTITTSLYGETLFAGCCFDLQNLVSQIRSVQFQSENIETRHSENDKYQPKYTKIINVLKKAQTKEELMLFQDLLVNLAHCGSKLASIYMAGHTSDYTQLFKELLHSVDSAHAKALAEYTAIVNNCTCEGDLGQRHQATMRNVISVLEKGRRTTPHNLAMTTAKMFMLHLDSWEFAAENMRQEAFKHTGAFITRKGFVGFSFQQNLGMEVGDVLAKIYGMAGLAILKDVGDGTFRLRGFCYVLGLENDKEIAKLTDLQIGIETDLKII